MIFKINKKRLVLVALCVGTFGLLSSHAGAKDKVEIKSGVSGSYCVPFDSPQCRSFNTMEADRVFEKRQQERRIEDLERRERQRELEYRLERDRYRDEYRR